MLPVLPQTALPSTLLADLNAARTYSQQSLSEATRTAYVSDWRAFEGWCADRDVEALPASPASVAAFLDMAERGLRPATIARRCAAIRHFHRLAGVDPAPTDAAIVKTTKGLRRSLGAAQAEKAPATNVVAKRLVDAMPDGSLKGRRDRAMVMLGFAGAFRKSEVVALNVEDLEFCCEGVRATIRRSKTDQEGKGQTIAVLRGSGPFCPVKLLREWLEVAGITEGALFRQVPKGGKRIGERLSGRGYYEVIKRGIAAVGLDATKFGSHSMRSGWISTAAKNGASVWKMKEISRFVTLIRPSHPVRHFCPFRNHRFFCSRLRAGLLVERFGTLTRLTPIALASAWFFAEKNAASAAAKCGARPSNA
jgi:site-specific recombinase XerC